MKFWRTCVLTAVVCVVLVAFARLSANAQESDRKLTICHNTKFALCAASTCTATGGTITGNDGKTHDAVSCFCPVLQGDNIADLNGGNMQGSCNPSSRNNVWSTFQFNYIIPQKIGPIWNPFAAAPPQVCPASSPFSQCWNWNCTLLTPEQARAQGAFGITLAQCTCPAEQTAFDFGTQAGQGNSAACGQLPVGAPLFFDPEDLLGPAS
jgi:hypothetical protein